MNNFLKAALTLVGWTGASLLSTVAMAPPALAHHSFAMFDKSKTVSVTGTVKDFQWTNPHIWIDLLTTDPVTSKQSVFSVEGPATGHLIDRGWSRHSIQSGDKATVVVNPLRSGSDGGTLLSASVNGKPIGEPMGPPPGNPPDGGPPH